MAANSSVHGIASLRGDHGVMGHQSMSPVLTTADPLRHRPTGGHSSDLTGSRTTGSDLAVVEGKGERWRR